MLPTLLLAGLSFAQSADGRSFVGACPQQSDHAFLMDLDRGAQGVNGAILSPGAYDANRHQPWRRLRLCAQATLGRLEDDPDVAHYHPAGVAEAQTSLGEVAARLADAEMIELARGPTPTPLALAQYLSVRVREREVFTARPRVRVWDEAGLFDEEVGRFQLDKNPSAAGIRAGAFENIAVRFVDLMVSPLEGWTTKEELYAASKAWLDGGIVHARRDCPARTVRMASERMATSILYAQQRDAWARYPVTTRNADYDAGRAAAFGEAARGFREAVEAARIALEAMRDADVCDPTFDVATAEADLSSLVGAAATGWGRARLAQASFGKGAGGASVPFPDDGLREALALADAHGSEETRLSVCLFQVYDEFLGPPGSAGAICEGLDLSPAERTDEPARRVARLNQRLVELVNVARTSPFGWRTFCGDARPRQGSEPFPVIRGDVWSSTLRDIEESWPCAS